MRRVLIVAVLVALQGRPAWPVTLTVSGVVLLPDGSRASGIDVGLYSSLKKGKPLAQDRTPATGVYILMATNIVGSVGDLFVRYDGQEFLARPVRVHLGGYASRRRAQPDDLKLMPHEPTAEEIGSHIAAFADSAKVDSIIGLIDEETANQKVGLEIARVTENVAASPLALYDEVQKKTEFAGQLVALQPDKFLQAVGKAMEVTAIPASATDPAPADGLVWVNLVAALLSLVATISGIGLYLRRRRKSRASSLLRVTDVRASEFDKKWRVNFSFKGLELLVGERLFVQVAAEQSFQEPLISERFLKDENLGRGFVDVPLDCEPSVWLRLLVRNREDRMLYSGVAQRFDIVVHEGESA